jgi:hypothetical protein
VRLQTAKAKRPDCPAKSRWSLGRIQGRLLQGSRDGTLRSRSHVSQAAMLPCAHPWLFGRPKCCAMKHRVRPISVAGSSANRSFTVAVRDTNRTGDRRRRHHRRHCGRLAHTESADLLSGLRRPRNFCCDAADHHDRCADRRAGGPSHERGVAAPDIHRAALCNSRRSDTKIGELDVTEILIGHGHAPRYLIRDRDTSYGPVFVQRLRAMGTG